MARKKWVVPLNQDGSLQPYPESYRDQDADGVWHRWGPTEAGPEINWLLDLTFSDFDKGYSSAYRFIGTDADCRRWPMSVSEFQKMMLSITIKKGRVKGLFGVAKRGANYSLKYMGKS